jgi:hypothetical protein
MKDETTGVIETPIKETKIKPPVIPTPRQEGVSGRKPIKVRLFVGKDFLRRIDIPSNDSRRKATCVYHLYPLLADWVGRTLPDGVNPRSHDVDCLKSSVARKIEECVLEKPEDFFLANRGSTIIAEYLEFDAKSGMCEIIISDPENQGLADGATTDAVLAKVQTEIAREVLDRKDATYADLLNEIETNKKLDISKVPEVLRNGRIHLEVFVGLDDRTRIASLAEGRNTSRQVTGWSMANFKGDFDFLKSILEKEFPGKVGFEENSPQPISIMDVLAVLTLFHPEFDGADEQGREKAPVIAYANKGRMHTRLDDSELRKGYSKLTSVVSDVLKLHDYIYTGFEAAYDKAFGNKSRLGRREGVTARHDNPIELPLTELKSNFVIPAGFLFPLLAAFRSLVVYETPQSKAGWKGDPFKFFDKHGPILVAELMEQVESCGGNPNVAGKKKQVYTALHTKAQLALLKK